MMYNSNTKVKTYSFREAIKLAKKGYEVIFVDKELKLEIPIIPKKQL